MPYQRALAHRLGFEPGSPDYETTALYRLSYRATSWKVRRRFLFMTRERWGGGGKEMRGTGEQWRIMSNKKIFGGGGSLSIFDQVEQSERSKWSVKWRGVQWRSPMKLRGFRHLITVSWASRGRSPQKLRVFRHLITVRWVTRGQP